MQDASAVQNFHAMYPTIDETHLFRRYQENSSGVRIIQLQRTAEQSKQKLEQ